MTDIRWTRRAALAGTAALIARPGLGQAFRRWDEQIGSKKPR